MRVLVTGAGGFLGRHVARALLVEGFRVTGFDLKVANEPGVEWSIGDFRSLDAITRASHQHDAICHIGAIGDVYLAAADPPLAAAVNVTGSANVAEAALVQGCKVIYASTWEVYGRSQYEPVDEDHPCTPDHPYNVTKLAGEQMLLAADRLRGVRALALRLGTAYGSGLRPNSVFSLFIDRARRNEAITIQGDGSQCRQFTHVSDIAQAFVLACRSDTHSVPLNVVATEQTSVKQLAELIVNRFPTDIVYKEARSGDIPTSLVSSARAESLLGWKAKRDFETGLNELIDTTEAG